MQSFLVSTLLFLGTDAALQKDIDLVVRQGLGSADGRGAWQRLSQAKADALPQLLEGMSTKDTVAANWLRTAFDRIVEREVKAGKKIDPAPLLAFVKDPTKNGRARRFALEMIEQWQPGTSAKIFPTCLDDPEFRFEAVALVLDQAKQAAKAGDADAALKQYRLAFDKSRDVLQAREAAAGLRTSKIDVGIAEHLGFLTDWWLIGPFDSKGQKGFHLSYAPEKKVDLSAALDGKDGKVRWKRYRVKEGGPKSPAKYQALVDLREKRALGDADDAVAFAYTEFSVVQPMNVEMRGAADDNFIVWVNGVRVFGFEEWRNGVRLDRHRFPVYLKEGKNTVLVKICQSEPPNPEANWEFLLRVVDATGKGIAMKNLLK